MDNRKSLLRLLVVGIPARPHLWSRTFFVRKKRDDVAFSPRDQQSLESFLQLKRGGGNVPFTQYYRSVMEKSASGSLLTNKNIRGDDKIAILLRREMEGGRGSGERSGKASTQEGMQLATGELPGAEEIKKKEATLETIMWVWLRLGKWVQIKWKYICEMETGGSIRGNY
ncbi:hypothetical protein GH714_008982 [Hevea brasiliensis]|uniref:Uncharacterized protein n=1 Tax=Hevea brasiliensis TaxID=3981 RepID=A0A6A6MXD4_HEVBR|nr:hypothetical protein GH714_008982 [Hevea brasiliensis]